MSSEIKILRVINRFNVGGISYNVGYLSKYLSPLFTTKIIGGSHEKFEKSSKYIFDSLQLKIYYIPFMSRSINFFKDVMAMVYYLFQIFKYRPRIVHSHASKAGLISRIPFLFYKPNIKVVHTYHGNVFDGYFTGLKRSMILYIERLLAKKTDLIIAISEKQKYDLLYNYKICTSEKIQVVHLGFDLNQFIISDKFDKSLIRSTLAITSEEFVLTIVGRLVPIKNHLLFLEVFLLLKKNTNKKIKGLIVGDGDQREKLEEFCFKSGLKMSYGHTNACEYDIYFMSWREDIAEIYAASDFVLLTSLNEGTPVSIIEAMAAKKVVLTTNVGGVSDIIPANCGYITDFNPNTFVSILTHLMDAPVKIHEIGNNAHKAVINKFTYTNLCEKMESEYLKLLNNTK